MSWFDELPEELQVALAFIFGLLWVFLASLAIALIIGAFFWLTGTLYAFVWNHSFGSIGLPLLEWWQALCFCFAFGIVANFIQAARGDR